MESRTVVCLVLFSFALSQCPNASAHAVASIAGSVRDAQTLMPLPGANVLLVGTNLGSTTDLSGRYVIRNVPGGTQAMRSTYVGYEAAVLVIEVPEEGTVVQDFRLKAAGIEGETVIVTAQATGQTQAINQQLAATQIMNVVSSVRIQEFPDANAAESAGRLPGVSILRSGGEGNQVVIRGLQPKYNAIMIDGVRMASSDPNDRSVDLSMISPAMLDGIEVIKAVTPDLDADVLGGTVNFRMREPRGEQEEIGVRLLAQQGYNGLSNATHKYRNYKYVASVEGRLFDERLGLFAQADLEERNLTSNEFGASYDHLGNSMAEYITSGLNLHDIPRDRRRVNGALVLDYRLPDGKIGLINFLSTGVTDIQDRTESYDIQGNLHNFALVSRKSTLNTMTNALNVEHQVSLFHVSAKLSHSYSETKNPDNWGVSFQQGSAGLGQFLNRPQLNPLAIPKAATNDPSTTYLGVLWNNGSFSRERTFSIALDLEAPLRMSDNAGVVIKFGGKYRYQTRLYDFSSFYGYGLGFGASHFVANLIGSHFASTAPYVGATSFPITCFIDPDYDYGRFLNGDYAMMYPLSFDMLSDMIHFVRNNVDLIAQNGLVHSPDDFGSTTNDYSGFEKHRAFYVMATMRIGPDLTIVSGIRYQDLTTTYTAARGQQNTTSGLGGPYLHYDTTLAAEHDCWLPGLLLRYKPLSWFDVRLSYTNTVTSPDYQAIIPRIDRAIDNTIAWNNYLLVPTRAKNYDVYLSFYDNAIGLFTVGGFLKRIENLIYPWSFYVSDSNAQPYLPPQIGAPPPTGTFNVTTYVNNSYRIDDWGVEIDWQTHFWYLPHPLDGLVLGVNYTHIFSKAQYPFTELKKLGTRGPLVFVDTSFTDRLLYQPNNILNLSLGYDVEGFSVRVSMMYQDDVFTGPNFWPQLRTHSSSYTRWDCTVRQLLPWFGLELHGDLNNINGIDDVSVISASTRVPQSEQSYGLTAELGIRCRF